MKKVNVTNELTHNNHFKFGFNGLPFSIRDSIEDKWFVSYGKVERQPWSFRDECIETVRLLRRKTDKTLYVMYSGGIDSEVVLNAFIAADIDNWMIFSLNYKGVNLYDLEQIEKYLDYRGLRNKHQYFDINLKAYWDNDVVEDMKKYGSVSPQFPMHINAMKYVTNNLNGYPVVGSAECYFEKQDNQFVMFEREKVASLYRGLYLNCVEGCAGFFQYTPELMASWILDSEFKNYILNAPDFVESLRLKHLVYKKHFDLPERIKQTGFEYYKQLDISLREKIKEFPQHAQDSIVKTPLNDLKQQLGI